MNTLIEKAIKLIVIYARVSTARQEDEKTIETQLLAIREFAQENGYTIMQEYIDDGWSGDMLARPALDELRNDAKKRVWDAVLFYDPDRLARRYSFQELVMDELRELGIEPLFVTIPPSKNNEDRLMYGVRGVFAEYERTKIAERFRLGKVRKAKEGNIIASEAPYGYTLIKRRGKAGDVDFSQTHYEINKVEARVVRMIFSWVADDGLNIRQVVKRLQELKVLPRKSKRGVWSTSTLTTLVHNKTYVGEGHFGASYAVVPNKRIKKQVYRRIKKTSRRMKPEDEWIKIPTPTILDKGLFERVQQQLKENKRLARRNRKNDYLLAGKIRCACGCTRGGEGPQKGRYTYYRCNSRQYSFPLPPPCPERGINSRIADELVWNKIAELMSSPDLMRKQIERWIESKGNKVSGPLTDTAPLEKEIAKLKSEEERYAKAYGAGLFTLEQLQEYATPIKEKVAALESQVMKARAASERINEPALPESQEIKAFAEKASKALHDLNFEAKRAIVMSVVENIIGTPSKLEVYGYLPLTEYVGFKTNDRHRGAPERWQVYAF